MKNCNFIILYESNHELMLKDIKLFFDEYVILLLYIKD